MKARRVVPGFRWDPKSGRAAFEVVVPGTNSRRRRRLSTFASSRADALEKWKAFRDSVLSGSWKSQNLTLAGYVERYASTMSARVSKRTRRIEADVLRVRVLPFLGHVPLAKINAAMVRDLVGQLKRDGYKVRGSSERRPYSAAAINQALAILRKFLRDAVDRGELAAYPIRGKLPLEREDRLELELSTEERHAFLAAFDDQDGFRRDLEGMRSKGTVAISPHFGGPRSFGGGRRPEGESAGYHFGRFQAAKILFVVALETGLSRSDLLALHWSSVDLKGGWVRLPRAKTGVESVIRSLRPAGPLSKMRGRGFHFRRSFSSPRRRGPTRCRPSSDISRRQKDSLASRAACVRTTFGTRSLHAWPRGAYRSSSSLAPLVTRQRGCQSVTHGPTNERSAP